MYEQTADYTLDQNVPALHGIRKQLLLNPIEQVVIVQVTFIYDMATKRAFTYLTSKEMREYLTRYI